MQTAFSQMLQQKAKVCLVVSNVGVFHIKLLLMLFADNQADIESVKEHLRSGAPALAV